LVCDSGDGNVKFKANLWGLAGTTGEFGGSMSFDDELSYYKDKSCNVNMEGLSAITFLNINCHGYEASMWGAGINFGAVDGSGRFE
jgi:hypothetical protein